MPVLAGRLTDQPYTKAQLKAYVRTTLYPALHANDLKRALLATEFNSWWDTCTSISGKADDPKPDEPEERGYITSALQFRQQQAAETYFQKLGAYHEMSDDNPVAKGKAAEQLNRAVDSLAAVNHDYSERAKQYQADYAVWERQRDEPATQTRLTSKTSYELGRLKTRLQRLIEAHNKAVVYTEPRYEETRANFRAFPDKFIPTRHYYRLAREGTWPMYFFEYDEVGLEAHLHYDSIHGSVVEVIIKLTGEVHGEHAGKARFIAEHLTTTYALNWTGVRVPVQRPGPALRGV
jgi:hypothetical protein